MNKNKFCPCGTKIEYDKCCKQYHSGKEYPETAEKLMKSRYSAYVKKEFDYLINTVHPDTRKLHNFEDIKNWANYAVFTGLTIINTKSGLESDKTGKVEFKAKYIHKEIPHEQHEVSRFKKYNGKWFYLDGIVN